MCLSHCCLMVYVDLQMPDEENLWALTRKSTIANPFVANALRLRLQEPGSAATAYEADAMRCAAQMPDEEKLRALIRKGTIGNAFVPVLCGSAFKNKGVQPLLDAVNAYLPSPLDVPPMKVRRSGTPLPNDTLKQSCHGSST